MPEPRPEAGADPATRGEPIGRVVARLRAEFPDLTVSTLHFLEREGLLTPSRSAGGHRLFAPADVDRVRQIKRWQAQRLSIAEIRDRLRSQAQLPPLPNLAGEVREALLIGEIDHANRLLRQAQERGHSFVDLCEQVLRPVLVEIGDLWAAQRISIAQEHEASAAARDALATLAGGAPRRPTGGRTALTACAEGEHHELGQKMIALALELFGWRVHYLGADVPIDSLIAAVGERRPDLVLLSATLEANLPAAIAAGEAIRDLPPAIRPRVYLGGQALSRLPVALAQPAEVSIGGLADLLTRIARDFPEAEPADC